MLTQVQSGDPSVPPIFFIQARAGYWALAEELGAEHPVYVVPYDDLFVRDTERSLENMAGNSFNESAIIGQKGLTT